MTKHFFTDILMRRPELATALVRYNMLSEPSRQPVPEELRKALDNGYGPHSELCWKHAAVRRRFPQDVKSGSRPFWDFVEDSRRLAFLDLNTLTRLALLFGATLHAGELSRIVLRTEVLAISGDLGEELLSYARTRGVFRQNALSTLFQDFHTDLPVNHRVRLHGEFGISLLTNSWPETLHHNFMLRWQTILPGLRGAVPPEAAVIPAALAGSFTKSTRQLLWGSLKKLLLQEVAPSWALCFD